MACVGAGAGSGRKLEEQGLNTQRGGVQRPIQVSPLVLMVFSRERNKGPVRVYVNLYVEQVRAWMVNSGNKPKT